MVSVRELWQRLHALRNRRITLPWLIVPALCLFFGIMNVQSWIRNGASLHEWAGESLAHRIIAFGALLILGTWLFFMRWLHLGIYAAIEIVAGIGGVWIALGNPASKSGTGVSLTLLASLYVFVRGLTNAETFYKAEKALRARSEKSATLGSRLSRR